MYICVCTRNTIFMIYHEQAQQNFVVTEPSLPDNPIVFASDGFLKLTGYTSKQASRVDITILLSTFRSRALYCCVFLSMVDALSLAGSLRVWGFWYCSFCCRRLLKELNNHINSEREELNVPYKVKLPACFQHLPFYPNRTHAATLTLPAMLSCFTV